MRYNGAVYYYVLNAQGDVVGLINTSGTLVATYTYDPWGKVISSSGSLADVNPLRYRGYYYDAETGFYYLQSRYYDPAIGRLISADSYATTNILNSLSANMFAYCENDPVNNSDPNGNAAQVVVGALVGGTVSAICEAVGGGSSTDVVRAFVVGAIEGAVCSFAPMLTAVTGIKTKTISAIAQMGVAVYETSKMVYECRRDGSGWGKSVLMGAAVFASSFMYGQTGDLLTDAVFDMTYGLGASLSVQMMAVETAKSSNRRENSGFNNQGKHYISNREQSRYNVNPYIMSTSPR